MQTAAYPKKYFSNLDATRYFSFLHIFANHVFFTNSAIILNSGLYIFIRTYVARGFFGIDYFFVLSSFLITWIILEEKERTGNFNIGFFLIRRCLRLWPLYFAVVLLAYIAVEVGQRHWGVQHENVPPLYNFLFFILNFYIINHGDNFLFFLVFFWSISIEEQFYLCWAFFLKFFKRYFVQICILIIVVSLLYRYINCEDNDKLVYHTFSLFGNFGVGALTAYTCFFELGFINKLKRLSRTGIIFIYIFIALNIIFYNQLYNYTFSLVFERLIFALFFGFIIFEQEFCANSFIKLGRWKFINYLGSMSFGLYCFHGICITLLIKLSEKFPQLCDSNAEVYFLNPLVIMILTIILSILSYEYFEKRMLLLKNKFYAKPAQ
jgi:peptidoglycan/LPS O-acetylase OafA/YrhL